MAMSPNQKITWWLNISIGFLLVMILAGGSTRLTDSGLSIVTWKPIVGVIPPITSEQWIDSFEEYKLFPQFKIINSNINLSDYKNIYYAKYYNWIEWQLIIQEYGFQYYHGSYDSSSIYFETSSTRAYYSIYKKVRTL